MIQRLKQFLLTSFASVLFLAPVAVGGVVSAQTDEIGGGLCKGGTLEVNGTATCEDAEAASAPINNIIKLVINMFSLVVGIISVIMIIIGGLKYIMSGGEGANITGAKNTILYAIIGLVIVALAQIVVKFVLAKTLSSSTGTESL